MIEIKTFAKLAKSLAVKREKDADDDTAVACHLKFSEMFVEREVFDELCRQPIGWHEHFYDEQGAPVGALEISLPGRAWSVTGSINAGPQRAEQLRLLEAQLTGVSLDLTKLGVLVSGAVSWKARGDEVEDLTELLGGLVSVEWRLTDGGQQDMLAANHATEFCRSMQRQADRDGTTTTLEMNGEVIAKFEPREGAGGRAEHAE